MNFHIQIFVFVTEQKILAFREKVWGGDFDVIFEGFFALVRYRKCFFMVPYITIFRASPYVTVKAHMSLYNFISITMRKIHGKITRTIFNRTKSRATFEIDGPIKIERFAWKKCNVHAKRSVSKSVSFIASSNILNSHSDSVKADWSTHQARFLSQNNRS